MSKIPIGAILEGTAKVLTNKKVRKTLFGEYTDGSARSLSDCLDGEILSPKERKKYTSKKKKSKKKKKIY